MHRAKRFFLRWEWLLVLLILGVFAFFSWKMPGSYTFPKLLDQTRVYMVDVGFMALGAMLILILGDIDISVASTAALSVTAMSVAYSAGSGMPFGAALARSRSRSESCAGGSTATSSRASRSSSR